LGDERAEYLDPYILRCSACGRQIDERVETVWSKVEGWEKKRSGGGTNHVALRVPLYEFMCALCMDKLQNGIPALQTGMF
jgi:hypothetical protein